MGGWRLFSGGRGTHNKIFGLLRKSQKNGLLGYLNKAGRISGTRSATKSYLHLNSKRLSRICLLRDLTRAEEIATQNKLTIFLKLTPSNTLNASRISSSAFWSLILRAIMARNSGKSIEPVPSLSTSFTISCKYFSL